VREVAVSSLESFGYRLLAAENGLAALDVLKGTERVDLLLVDMAMPGMNGVEVIRWRASVNPVARAARLRVRRHCRILAAEGDTFSRSPIVWHSWPTASRGVATREVQTAIKRSENEAVAAEGIRCDCRVDPLSPPGAALLAG